MKIHRVETKQVTLTCRYNEDLEVTHIALSAISSSQAEQRQAEVTARVDTALVADYTLLIREPVCIAGAAVQAITWEKWDDPLLWVFLPSLYWELVKYLHLMKEKGRFTLTLNK